MRIWVRVNPKMGPSQPWGDCFTQQVSQHIRFQGPAEEHGTPPTCGALRPPSYQHPFSLRVASRVSAPKTEKKTLSRTSAGIRRLFSVTGSLLSHTQEGVGLPG